MEPPIDDDYRVAEETWEKMRSGCMFARPGLSELKCYFGYIKPCTFKNCPLIWGEPSGETVDVAT